MEPTEEEDEKFDAVMEELSKFEELARQARIRLEEGDFGVAIDILDEGDNFAGDSWRELIESVKELKEIQDRLHKDD